MKGCGAGNHFYTNIFNEPVCNYHIGASGIGKGCWNRSGCCKYGSHDGRCYLIQERCMKYTPYVPAEVLSSLYRESIMYKSNVEERREMFEFSENALNTYRERKRRRLAEKRKEAAQRKRNEIAAEKRKEEEKRMQAKKEYVWTNQCASCQQELGIEFYSPKQLSLLWKVMVCRICQEQKQTTTMNEIESQLTEYGKTLTNDTSMITSAVNFIFKKVIPAIHEKINKMGQNDVISMLKRSLTTKLKKLQAESSTTAATTPTTTTTTTTTTNTNTTNTTTVPATLLKMNDIKHFLLFDIESPLTEYGKTLTNDTSMITSAVNYIFKKVIPAIHEKIKKRGQNDVIRMLKRALTTKLKQLQAESSTKENVQSNCSHGIHGKKSGGNIPNSSSNNNNNSNDGKKSGGNIPKEARAEQVRGDEERTRGQSVLAKVRNSAKEELFERAKADGNIPNYYYYYYSYVKKPTKENVKSFLTKCDKCDNSEYFPKDFVWFDNNQSRMNGIHQRICKFCPSPENDPHRHPHEFESIHDESDENEDELFCDDCEDLKDTGAFSKYMCGKRPGPDSNCNLYRQCIDCYNKRYQTPKNGIDMCCDNCKVIKKFPKNISQYYGQTIDDHYFFPRYCCDCVKGIKNGYAILK